MPFKIIRNDITKVKADIIVNTANPQPMIGSGTDSAIYYAAGAEDLLAERKKIGNIKSGEAAVTPAFGLSAKYIIHTVGPAWEDGKHGECDVLRSCYEKSLALAAELSAESIVFPLIATGVYGFPKDEALSIALSTISKFLLSHDMKVILVVFDRKAFELSGKLVSDIDEYIDEHMPESMKREDVLLLTKDSVIVFEFKQKTDIKKDDIAQAAGYSQSINNYRNYSVPRLLNSLKIVYLQKKFFLIAAIEPYRTEKIIFAHRTSL